MAGHTFFVRKRKDPEAKGVVPVGKYSLVGPKHCEK